MSWYDFFFSFDYWINVNIFFVVGGLFSGGFFLVFDMFGMGYFFFFIMLGVMILIGFLGGFVFIFNFVFVGYGG